MNKTKFCRLMLIVASVMLLLTLSTDFCVGQYSSANIFANNAHRITETTIGKYAGNVKTTSSSDEHSDPFYYSTEQIVALSKFDPRNTLTNVKDQGDSNLCWAYSAINATEASVLKHKIGTKDSLNLNPNALAYRKYIRNADPLGNNGSYQDKNYAYWLYNAGTIEQTPAILSMWQGPISGDRPSADVWENSLYRLESANLINSELTGEARIEEIKRAIAEYGAVTASCYYDGGTRHYYNDKAVTNGIAHAITLIGWDDNIDKSLFAPGQVSTNGGWLVKNSYNDNPYFWLTYESKIASSTAWTFTYAPRETYDYNYYYDNNETDFGLATMKQAANVYEAKKGTAEKSEYIEAANVGFVGSDVQVTVKVYTNLSGWGSNMVESGVLAAEKTQTFKYGGYNTIKFDNPIEVAAGSYFSIVTEVSNQKGDASIKSVQTDNKRPSYQKSSYGYDYIMYGGRIARIKAYTKLRDTKTDCTTHDYGNLIPTIPATCMSTGTEAHYICSKCGKYFDRNKLETTLEELTIPINQNSHVFSEWIDETPSDCTVIGTKGHKDCKLCGKHFDIDGKEMSDITIPTDNNHDWGDWQGNGNGTHSRTCKRNPTHVDSGSCLGGQPTCTQKAVCEVCGESYGDILGHDWNEAVYSWPSKDVCFAERVCKRDKSHTESERVKANESVVTPATCTTKGKLKYTTTNFTNSAFAVQQYEVEVGFGSHAYGKWVEEVPPTTTEFGTLGHKDCTVCGKHFDKEDVEITDLTIAKLVAYRVEVNGGVGGGYIENGKQITIKADMPKMGEIFKGWKDANGKIVSNDSEYTFVVNGNVSLTAVYESIPSDDDSEPIVPQPEEKEGLSDGTIVGIVVGAVAAAALVVFVVVRFVVKKKNV